MSLYAGIRRRFGARSGPALAGPLGRDRPEASYQSPCGRREPHGAAGPDRSAYLAIAEALRAGADVVPASDEVGRRLAADGVSLLEALDGLGALYRSIAGGEPAFAAVRALSSSWAEASLIYLHSLSCEDPLTGLSSLAHLRSRLGELYREADQRGTSVPATHALVVVEPFHPAAASPFERDLRLAEVARCLRIVFAGGDVLGRLGARRAAALVGREPYLPDQVEAVRGLIAPASASASRGRRPARLWVEGLPASDRLTPHLLGELTRTGA